MPKYTPTSVKAGFNLNTINDNFDNIASELNDKVLYRNNPAGEANQWETQQDANSQRLINLNDAVSPSEPATLRQLNAQSVGVQSVGISRASETATAGQTLFATSAYTPGTNNLSVYINGVRQDGAAYVETSSTSFTLSEGVQLGDNVEYIVNEYPELVGTTAASAVTFTQVGTGAVPSNVQSKLEESVSVMDFGGVGDGIVDDTVAVQAWLDTSGKILIGSEGTFKVTSSLVSGVADRYLRGNGMILAPTDAFTSSCLDLQADGQIVEGFTLEAEATAQCSGINIGAFSNCEIRFNKLSNFDGSGGTNTGAGIICSSQGQDHLIHHNRLIDCMFSHAADQYGSIHCNAGGSIVEYNMITDAQQTCVSVAGGSAGNANHIQISNNVMVGKAGASASGGVNVDGYTVGSVISDNSIRDMAVEGILVAGSLSAYSTVTTDVTITGNNLFECVVGDVVLQGNAIGDVSRVLIEGNKGFRSTGTNQALIMTFADHVDILGNQFYGHDTGYIVTQTSRYHNVQGNSFINQDNVGIAAFASKSMYSNNRIYGDGSSTKGISFNASTTAGDLTVHGNSIRNCDIGINGTFDATTPAYVYGNNLGDNTTNFNYTGELTDSSWDNTVDEVRAGEATLVAGAVNVLTGQVATGDKIEVLVKTPAGTRGALYINSIVDATSFAIRSTSATDTSVVFWRIIR